MEIFPAIDIKDGQVVRLTQGDYNKSQVYFEDPFLVAEKFIEDGAKSLHMVDLDGAKDGNLVNYNKIKKIIESGKLFIQVGGGIRNEENIKRYLDVGVNRVILGTVAIEDSKFLKEMTNKYKEKIAVSVDARDQKVAVKGWREITDIDSIDFCKNLEHLGVQTIIYTDIHRDGLEQGTNLDIYKILSKNLKCNIIASGGITFLEEFKSLKDTKIYGAIVGKALYNNRLSLKEVLSSVN